MATSKPEWRDPIDPSLDFDLKSYPLLYVDDEPLALELFRDVFSPKFQVFTAHSAFDALGLIEKQDIALVLSDQRMPGMLGTEFFAEIQKSYPEIIRILVTGYVDVDSVVSAINAGHVYHYIEKPWDDDELELTMRRALEHFHLVRERDRLQAERIKTLEKMARSNRLAAVGTLAAGIAHEIRNPLSAIITFHQMLPEKIEEVKNDSTLFRGEFWTQFSKIPLKEVERIKQLVQELLDFSRDSGSNYDFQKTCISDILGTVFPIIESDLRRKNIQLIKNFDPDLAPIELDKDKIKQVIINLLLNSMHSILHEGKIELNIQAIKENESDSRWYGGCEIIVQDTGVGIQPRNIERVFDPFFTTKDPGLGTGLGLTMCHYIITNHGGEISLKSEEGEGTRVSIRLPKSPMVGNKKPKTPIPPWNLISESPRFLKNL